MNKVDANFCFVLPPAPLAASVPQPRRCSSSRRRVVAAASLSPPSVLDSSLYQPLRDRRVMFTTPQHYAPRLAELLASAGARPVWAPCVTSLYLDSGGAAQRARKEAGKHEQQEADDDDDDDDDEYAPLDDALLSLHEFDYIAFTSRFGIDALHRRTEGSVAKIDRLSHLADGDERRARTVLEASGVRVCALGRDGERVKDLFGRAPDVIPLEASPLGLVRHLASTGALSASADDNFSPQRGGAPVRVLCPVPRFEGIAEPRTVADFLNALRDAGADAVPLDAYRTLPTPQASTAVERSLLLQGDIDALAFTSGAEASALSTLVPPALLPPHVVVAAFGPYTALSAQDAGFSVAMTSSDFASFEGLVRALAKHFANLHPPTQLIRLS